MSSAKRRKVVLIPIVLSLATLAFGQTEPAARIKQLVAKLIAAQTDEERQSLLAPEKDITTPDLIAALIAGGNQAWVKGDLDGAMRLARFTLALAERIGDGIGVARSLLQIANVHYGRSEYEEALAYHRKSLPLMEAAKYQTGVANVITAMGLVHRVQGDLDTATELFARALALSHSEGDKLGVASALNSIGIIHRAQGNTRMALESYQKALALFQELAYDTGVAGMVNNIGNLYQLQGQYALAESSYRQSLALAEKLKNRPQVALALNNIGLAFRDRGDGPKALEFFKQSLAIREEIGDRLGVARTLANLAETYSGRNLREYGLALDIHHRALPLLEALGNKQGLSASTAGIAHLHQLRGDHKASLEWAERAVRLARDIDKDTLWRALSRAGAAHRGLGQFEQAQAAFSEAVAVVEQMRGDVAGGEQERQGFLERNIGPYQSMVDLLVGRKQWGEAFAWAERAKARVLLDVLQSGRSGVGKAMTGDERTQEQKLRGRLVAVNSQLTRETQSTKADESRLADLKAQLQTARRAYEAFRTNLDVAHPELKVQRGEAPPVSLEEAGALLPDARSALIEYVVAEQKTYMFVLTRGRGGIDARAFTVDIAQSDLTEQAERFRQQLAQRDLAYGATARRLYDLLVKPAEAQLRGKDTLVIVPDGKLWELPFQALHDARGRHLIESHAISYAPSVTVLRDMRRPRRTDGVPSTPTLLAFGNPTLGNDTIARARSGLMSEPFEPLPEAEKQVMALGQLYGSANSRVYVGAAAREERVKADAAGFRVLHLATHGILDDASPMYSYVLLAQEDGNAAEDGLLEAWELMNLDLDADLVVLSACETARGRVGAGEGVIGLTWALFVAGSPATVVSQWKVDAASTTELMLEFHRNLRRSSSRAPTMSTSKALQLAATKMIAIRESSHPFYWAGFVLVGDGR